MLRAFALAGADPVLERLDAAIADPALLNGFDLFGFPGGFSFGDDIASGRIFAMKLRESLMPALTQALARGCPMIGVCNGFQTLVQTGLLPGPATDDDAEGYPPQTVALTDNSDARFHDRWVGVTYEPASRCVWTKGLRERCDKAGPDALILPVAHGEGRLVAQPRVLDALEARGQVALRYTDNFNGSANAIAGICDATGLIFGLMPHPERFLSWRTHPWWTRLPDALRTTQTPGLAIFQNAVRHALGHHQPQLAHL
jgi:phosphoribosylformylglycinamidine synthase